MTNIKRLIQKLNDKEELEYSLDQYDEYGILNIYKALIDNSSTSEKLADSFKKEFKLKEIVIKDHTKECSELDIQITGEVPSNIVAVEEDLKFLIHPLEEFEGLAVDQFKLRTLIEEYSKNKDVLNLFASTGSYTIYSLIGEAKTVDSVETAYSNWLEENIKLNPQLDLTKHTLWKDSYNDFINIAIETDTKYDLIILDCSKYNLKNRRELDLQKDQTNLIRTIQNKLLNTSGYLFFITDLEGFVMDPYIRRGADKITKTTVSDNFKPLLPHQSFVFYN